MSASVFARPSLVLVASTDVAGGGGSCGVGAGAVVTGIVAASGGADGARAAAAAVGLDPGLLVQASSSKPLLTGTVELDL